MTAQICVQFFVVSGPVPPSAINRMCVQNFVAAVLQHLVSLPSSSDLELPNWYKLFQPTNWYQLFQEVLRGSQHCLPLFSERLVQSTLYHTKVVAISCVWYISGTIAALHVGLDLAYCFTRKQVSEQAIYWKPKRCNKGLAAYFYRHGNLMMDDDLRKFSNYLFVWVLKLEGCNTYFIKGYEHRSSILGHFFVFELQYQQFDSINQQINNMNYQISKHPNISIININCTYNLSVLFLYIISSLSVCLSICKCVDLTLT